MKQKRQRQKPNRTIGLHDRDYAWMSAEAAKLDVPRSILMKRLIAAYKAVQAATAEPTMEVR